MSRSKNKGRNVSGVLLLDKPQGSSSNHALQKVKRLFGAAKAGHTGSLDPLATGMLPVCFGEATKISAFLLEADKRYHLKCQLGVSTTTGDAEGEIVETKDASAITEDDIKAVLPEFIGEIEQIPPMYSALKHNGERLYKLARQGIEVERKSRRITIYAIEFISLDNNILELEVSCSKGTYVRTLAEDINDAEGKVMYKKNQYITEDMADAIAAGHPARVVKLLSALSHEQPTDEHPLRDSTVESNITRL